MINLIRKMILPVLLLASTTAMAGEIVINKPSHTLTYEGQSYPVAVGRNPAMSRSGVYTVVAKENHPCWTPTPNMVRRGTRKRTVCGSKSPLGIGRLKLDRGYLGIHGTNNEASVGTNASHGCFRMHRGDIGYLLSVVPVGTKVIVQ